MRNYKNLNLNYPQIIETIIASRDIILKHFTPNQESAFERKSDNSKVAKADLETNSHIINSLQKFYPEIAIISEENPQEDNIQALLQDKVFIIDPIDGTNSFVRGDAEFTVNIALKIKDKLVAGAIYLPIRDVVYYAENGNLFKIENATNLEQNITKIAAHNKIKDKITVIATKRQDELQEIEKILAKINLKYKIINFSSSSKFCYMAENMADLYIRAARIKLWDVAAGFAICEASALQIINHNGNDLTEELFCKKSVENFVENNFTMTPFIVKKPCVKINYTKKIS